MKHPQPDQARPVALTSVIVITLLVDQETPIPGCGRPGGSGP